ncbi:hypothetical protein BDZ85DRAFT_277770 [Elsinoe ampelina]|uniref:Uncharacterized protein n=1 Tax=Elsinoe ampelina TaxID=302913 RepID=A0A6A6GQ80_9PEZI|nr:hypothetical protein BDZ85DRAFT_277770 [Elsinoe ampelina]
MGLITTPRSKYELYRLEQRYTRRDKRTTFASGAVYVDGEYIYANGAPAANPGEGAGEEGPWSPRGNGSGSASPAGSSGPSSPMSQAPSEGGKGPWGRVPEFPSGSR